MIDISGQNTAGDIRVTDTQNPKAANVLSIQLGSLEYLPDFGIDIDYFMTQDIEFQNDSFKAYIVERLAAFGISVQSVDEVVENLYSQYIVKVRPEQNSTGLIAR